MVNNDKEIESSNFIRRTLSEKNIQLEATKGRLSRLEQKEKSLEKNQDTSFRVFFLTLIIGGIILFILFPLVIIWDYLGWFWILLITWGVIVVSTFSFSFFIPKDTLKRRIKTLKLKLISIEYSIERKKRDTKSELNERNSLDLIEKGWNKFNERDFFGALNVFERAQKILKSSPSSQNFKEIQNILESKIKPVQEKLNELSIGKIKPIVEQGNLLKKQNLNDEAIKVFRKALKITNNLFKSPEKNQKIKEIKKLIDLSYLDKIKEINIKGNQLRKQMKFEESIKTYSKGLNLTKKMYDSKVKSNEISEIKSLIKQSKISKIKSTILILCTKFGRLHIMEISEECGEDESLIISTVREMIEGSEIYAKYFESSKSVAFDQQANIKEIDKLMEQYQQWEKEGISKK